MGRYTNLVKAGSALGLLCLCAIAFADPLTKTKDNTENFKVELIVFRFTHATSNPEQWQPQSFINLANVVELVTPDYSVEKHQSHYCLLPTNQMSMHSEESKLNKNDDTAVLMHVAWVQSITDSWHSKPVHISGGNNYTLQGELTNEIDGTVAISKGKFINVKLDLNFTEPLDRIQFSDNRHFFSRAGKVANALSYHFSQTRKMKLDELNYIDNPNFGMLVKVTPYKLPNEGPTELTKATTQEHHA